MSKTINEEILDAMVRHQTYLLRYSAYVRNRIDSIVGATEQSLAEKIRDRLRNNVGLSTTVEWNRLERLVAQVKAIRSGGWDKAKEFLENEMVQLSYYEPQFVSNAIAGLLPVQIETTMPSSRMLKSIALSRPFEGRTMRQWASTMQADDLRRIHSAIQSGMIAGEDNQTIARRVVGTRALRGADGVTHASRTQVNAVVRSAVMHVAGSARREFIQENADIIQSEMFVATLDARTTPQCAANDGKLYPLGEGPQPPLHWGCRSLRIAYMDGVTLGQRPAKPYVERELLNEYAKREGYGKVASRDALPYGTKGKYDKWRRNRIRDLVGPVPAGTNYNTWLRSQSNTFQADTLGVTKAKLFRDGGLSIDKFVDRNGNELTLAQLARREASAFRAAGLDPDKYDLA